MNNKLLSTILLILAVLSNSLILFANNFNEDDWQFVSTATGKTTGHIGDLVITNKTDKPNTIWLRSYIIPPENGRQGYVALKREVAEIEVQPDKAYTYQLNGYCINIDLPPVTKNQSFPDFFKWLALKDFDSTIAERWYQLIEKPETFDFETQLIQAGPIILEAVQNLDDQYFTWKSPLQIPDLYPANAKAVKEAMVQQAVWQFTSALQGKTYSFNNFEQSILKQEPVKTWLSLNGSESLVVAEESLSRKNYYNYQCQKLWSIINELNFYVNPSSRKLLSKWESNTGELETKQIEFQALWENVSLIGNYFKVEEIAKIVPEVAKEKANNKKALPYIIGGVGAAGLITSVVLLTGNEKGCTNKMACNYNEEAIKDDGNCEFEDCLGVCGGNAVMGATCDDGDAITINDTYNFACECVGTIAGGCTDEAACNYNSLATVDDGSCDFGNFYCADPCNAISGCTNSTACNYDDKACIDDGSCRFVRGCTDALFCNYNPEACIDDGSCIEHPCSELFCDLKEGIIRFDECGKGRISNCKPSPYYLIEYNGGLLDPSFQLVGNCFNGYEGQKILFDYNVVPAANIDTTFFTCTDIATPIYLTCLEANTEDCAKELVTIEVNKCDCDENEYAYLRTEDGEILEFYFSNCENETFTAGDTYKVDYGISNFDPSCTVADELAFVTCMKKIECPDPCDPNCLKTGTIRLNEDCLAGINRGCKEIPQYLIEYNGKLLTADLNSGDKCFYGYDGQVINFNFEVVPEDEIDDSYICSDIAIPVKITCLQTIPGNCESEEAELIGIDCNCFNRLIAFFKVGEEILEFVTPDCSSSGTTFSFGTYKIEYYDAGIEPGCSSVADKFVILTCYELQPAAKVNEPEPNKYIIQNLNPFFENRTLAIPIQNSEYPETVVTTTILGVNYYKPVTPTIFIQSQTTVGSILSSDSYFLNNNTTLNVKNPYLPIHYGLGLNSNQLTDLLSLNNWQSDVIWNLGLALPIFKKLQLEAAVFKNFNTEDAPNYNIRLIYRQKKTNDNINKLDENKKF